MPGLAFPLCEWASVSCTGFSIRKGRRCIPMSTSEESPESRLSFITTGSLSQPRSCSPEHERRTYGKGQERKEKGLFSTIYG